VRITIYQAFPESSISAIILETRSVMNWLSKNPKLSTEKFLVFGALAIYLFRHTMLQKKGQLGMSRRCF